MDSTYRVTETKTHVGKVKRNGRERKKHIDEKTEKIFKAQAPLLIICDCDACDNNKFNAKLQTHKTNAYTDTLSHTHSDNVEALQSEGERIAINLDDDRVKKQ